MGDTYGLDDWCCGCTIIAAFCCSCWVISAISTVVESSGEFGGGLSWVDGDVDVDIK